MSRVVRIECPQCRGTIELNLETGKILRHWAKSAPAAAKAEDFDALIAKVKKRSEETLPDIDRVLEEQKRQRDEAFERAKRKAQEEPPPADVPPPPGPPPA